LSYVPSCPALPPFLPRAGTNDRLVPYQQTSILADALRQHGGEVELHLLEGALHADRRFEEELIQPTIGWLNGHRTAAHRVDSTG
jgi:acetyl esterase/lipase